MGQDLSTLTPEELKKRQIREMDTEIKNKLGKGANYNMKIVIKGDSNTGKTCLFNRLQRKAFVEAHITTEEIQIATIPWDYKVSNDRIKVDVWDVVDHGKRKPKPNKPRKEGLKLTLDDPAVDIDIDEEDEEEDNTPSAPPLTADSKVEPGNHSLENLKLDAETIDVYKDANAVLFTMDPRKKWTFDYIERELVNIPKGIFVLILVNYRDCPQNQRVVSEYEIQEFANNAGKYVRAIECSMKNCYGMKGVRCFFNLPFLKIKRQYIMAQLKENEADLNAADQEFGLVNSEQNYEFYLKWLAENRQNRKAKDAEPTLPTGPPSRVPHSDKDSKHDLTTDGESKPEDPSSVKQPATSPFDSMKKLVSSTLLRTDNSQTPPKPDQPTQRDAPPKPSEAAKPKPLAQPPATQTPQKPKPAPSAEPHTPKTSNPAATPKTPQPPKTPTPATPKPSPTPTTPKTPSEPAAKPQPPQASPQAPAGGGGVSSWTKWFSRSQTTPTKPQIDVEKELSKVVEQASKNPAQKGSIEDFAPITDGTDADFWAVGDSDDDEQGRDDDDDDDDVNDTPKKYAIAKDEEPAFDPEPVEVKPPAKTEPLPPKAAKTEPLPPKAAYTPPIKAKPSAYHNKEDSDDEESAGYENFSEDGDDDDENEKDTRPPPAPKSTKEQNQVAPSPAYSVANASRSWSEPAPGLANQSRGHSSSYGNLPTAINPATPPVQSNPTKEIAAPATKENKKPKNKYVILKNEELPPLDPPTNGYGGTNGSVPAAGQATSGGSNTTAVPPEPQKEQGGKDERRRHKHRSHREKEGENGERKHRHRHKDREGSSGERRKHRSRPKGEDSQPRSSEYSGF